MNALAAEIPESPRFEVAADKLTVHDTTTGLTWTRDDAIDDDVTHEEAEAAIAQLNAQKFAGHDDWRLPTVDELFALADRTRCRPAIDTEAFPTCANDWYWTSTPSAYAPSEYAWVVGFGSGSAGSGGYRISDYRVRAVRGSARQ